MRIAVKKNLWLIIAIVIAAVGLSGCMVGPDYSRPQTALDTAQRYIYADNSNDVNEIGQWWRRFGDETTTQLVTEALNNNNDLQAAAARVLQAEALLVEAGGRQLPDISYNLSRSRDKRSFNFGGTGRFSNLSTTFSQDFSVSYIVDLFGRLKRQKRAAWADMLAARANGQSLVNAVISSVVKTRADIATIQRQLTIARANTENRQRNLEIIERRYEWGLVGPLDIRLVRENLAASKAAEMEIELSLVKTQNALDVILGRRPGVGQELPQTLPELPALGPVPVGLPASLLDRRPDVRAAEMALKSANEKIGVSIAQLYPDLTLTGTLGRNADRWRDIWKDETEIYSAVMRLAQPIFKGGQLRAQASYAKARYAELAANYAKAVLTALREVEDALIAEQILQRRLEALKLRFDEAIAAEQLAEQRYLQGVEPLITVLETERRRRTAETELNVVKGSLWAGRVDLFLALGGDWQVENTQP